MSSSGSGIVRVRRPACDFGGPEHGCRATRDLFGDCELSSEPLIRPTRIPATSPHRRPRTAPRYAVGPYDGPSVARAAGVRHRQPRARRDHRAAGRRTQRHGLRPIMSAATADAMIALRTP